MSLTLLISANKKKKQQIRLYDLRICCVLSRYTLNDIFLYHVQNTGCNSLQMIG